MDVTRSPSLGTLTFVLGSRVRPPVANVDFRLNYFVHVIFLIALVLQNTYL